MFEPIFDRSYRRNKTLLNAAGLSYSVKQHKLYKYRLLSAQMEPMSVKAVVVARELNHPVKAGSGSVFYRSKDGNEGSDTSATTIAHYRDDACRIADMCNTTGQPVVAKYVAVLADVVKSPLEMVYTQSVNDVHIKDHTIHTEQHGYEVRQDYTLSAKGIARQPRTGRGSTFAWLFDRSYRRNKKMLAGMGLSYDIDQHKLYKNKLRAQELDAVSVKGAIIANDLHKPVRKADVETYEKGIRGKENNPHWNTSKNQIDYLRNETGRKADKANEKGKPLIDKYVATLAQVTGVAFDVKSSYDIKDVIADYTHYTEKHAFIAKQEWTLVNKPLNRHATIV